MVTIKGSIKIQVEEIMVPVHDIPFSPFGYIFSPHAMHSSLYFVIDNGSSARKSQCFGGKNKNFRRGRGISFLLGCGSGRIRIRSGFNRVSRSGSVSIFGIRIQIRIQEGKNDPLK
jgi:hypothetical protein